MNLSWQNVSMTNSENDWVRSHQTYEASETSYSHEKCAQCRSAFVFVNSPRSETKLNEQQRYFSEFNASGHLRSYVLLARMMLHFHVCPERKTVVW